jgi:opacity protein-like surface antigen
MNRAFRPVVVFLFVFLSLAMSPLAGAGVADRLRELDRLRDAGLISEEEYQEKWHRTIEDAMAETRSAPGMIGAGGGSNSNNPADGSSRRYELGFSGAWMALDAADTDVELIFAGLDLGVFVTESVEVTGRTMYLKAEIEDLDVDALMLGIGVDYHFMPRSPIVPYVGAAVSWVRGSADFLGDDDDWAWEAHVGLKQRVTQNVDVKYQAAYVGFDKLDLKGVVASVGLSFRF